LRFPTTSIRFILRQHDVGEEAWRLQILGGFGAPPVLRSTRGYAMATGRGLAVERQLRPVSEKENPDQNADRGDSYGIP
jgi:hypothetical protein